MSSENTTESQQDRLEAFQPLTTGKEIQLRGRGTPDEWVEEIHLVDEEERRQVLYQSERVHAAAQVFNAIVELAESVEIVTDDERGTAPEIPPAGYSWHVREENEFIHKACGEIVPADEVDEHEWWCPA